MRDIVKEKIMEALGFTDEEQYWQNLDIYYDNLLAKYEILKQIKLYMETRDMNQLSGTAMTRLLHDLTQQPVEEETL